MNNFNTKPSRTRNRLLFLSVIALFVIPFLAAYWFFGRTVKTEVWGTTNLGTLIRPVVSLQDFTLIDQHGNPFTLNRLRGQWTLVFIPDNPCDEACKKNIYHMRQLWISLGKNAYRVQQLLLLHDAMEIQNLDSFLQNYPQTIVVVDPAQMLITQIESASPADEAAIVLVDPLSNLMMAFPQSLDPGDILHDLKKLLKFSQTG